MAKRFLFCMAAGALLLSSCSSEEPMIGSSGEGNVTFTATIPGGINSRAISDGTTANKLTYAVYNENGEEITVLTNTVDINLQTTVNLNLVTGKKYTVVFWAQAEDAPYSLNTSDGTVTVTATGDSQKENRDAFFASREFTVNGAVSETVELKRPFAQINVLTYDMAEFTAAEGTIANAGLKVQGPDVLNLKDGSVSGSAEYVFSNAAFPDASEKLPFSVAGKTMTWLVTDYILVGEAKEAIDVTWTSDVNVPSRQEITYTGVPVQRNYRTNIYGALLTDSHNYNVVINPSYNDPDFNHEIVAVATADAFVDAIANHDGAYIPEGVSLDITDIMPAGADDVSFEITKPTTIIVDGELKCENAGQMQVKSDIVIIGGQNDVQRKAKRITRGATEVNNAIITGGPRGLFNVVEGGSFYAENVTFNTPEAYRGCDVWHDGGGDVTFINCTFNSQMGCVIFQPKDDSSVLTIKNCVVNSTSRNSIVNPLTGANTWAYAIRVYGGTAEISDNEMTGIQGLISAAGGNVNVYSGTYTIHNSEGKQDGFYSVYTCTDGYCNIYGGNFYSPRYAVYNGNNDTTDIFGHLYLYGGNYSQKPAYDQKFHTDLALPEGYAWESTEDSKYPWKVVKSAE